MTALASRRAGVAPRAVAAIDRRALALWPRLDHRALARCAHDREAIARLVSRRTSLPLEAIRALLDVPTVSAEDGDHWFG